MKITKQKLKEIIREELMNETFIEPRDAGRMINGALEDLEYALKKVRNPEKWAEKYTRSLPGFLDQIDKVIRSLGRMK